MENQDQQSDYDDRPFGLFNKPRLPDVHHRRAKKAGPGYLTEEGEDMQSKIDRAVYDLARKQDEHHRKMKETFGQHPLWQQKTMRLEKCQPCTRSHLVCSHEYPAPCTTCKRRKFQERCFYACTAITEEESKKTPGTSDEELDTSDEDHGPSPKHGVLTGPFQTAQVVGDSSPDGGVVYSLNSSGPMEIEDDNPMEGEEGGVLGYD
ncbi:MAG: hypothetical protein Q9184_001888 [Pyrenodesmia sp. 2 TL-2023]